MHQRDPFLIVVLQVKEGFGPCDLGNAKSATESNRVAAMRIEPEMIGTETRPVGTVRQSGESAFGRGRGVPKNREIFGDPTARRAPTDQIGTLQDFPFRLVKFDSCWHVHIWFFVPFSHWWY